MACLTARWNPNSCLMVLMHHLNADPSVKRGWGGWWHVEKASTESESQMTEGCAQNADAVLEWNIKAPASLSGGI